jgi:transcriptional regulator with XRE-family HTH domain
MSLRELRQKRGMTQRQLADRVDGVPQSRIAAWETGQRDIGRASLETACRVADALHVSNPRKLLSEDESPKENTSSPQGD